MTTKATNRINREARLRWLPIGSMQFALGLTQREKINEDRVAVIAADFDPEQVGVITVNVRGDGGIYVLDGMHRVSAMRHIGWDDQQIQCWTYEGLTEAEEAEVFLKLNDTLTVNGFDKFKVGVNAGRATETEIDRVVRAQGLHVSRDKSQGSVRAVGTLRRVYERSDSATLGRTLRIIRDAYGDAGFESSVIDGIALVCQRYGSTITDATFIERLATTHGGVSGLIGKAEQLRKITRNAKGHCVAAAAVEIYNRGRGGKKIPDWWRQSAAAADLSAVA